MEWDNTLIEMINFNKQQLVLEEVIIIRPGCQIPVNIRIKIVSRLAQSQDKALIIRIELKTQDSCQGFQQCKMKTKSLVDKKL